jgi:hypothetical protein
MHSIIKKTALTGMLLGAVSLAAADVTVDDFTDWVGANKFGGLWLADGDVYSGGTSTVTEPVGDQDIIKNSANILMTYDSDNKQIISHIKVSADVPGKNWAYAGWVMDFKQMDTTGAGPEPWNVPQWDRKNEVDISGCTALEMDIGFTTGRQLWIEVYNPQQEKNFPLAPQYGWRYSPTADGVVTKKFNLKGLGAAVTKWTDPANAKPLDLTKINRIKILYEGQAGGSVAVPAPYDANVHTLTIKGVRLIGGDACKVSGSIGVGVKPAVSAKTGLSMVSASGLITFANFVQQGDLNVQVRNLAGKVVAQGVVNAAHPSLKTAGLENGVYAVQVSGSHFKKAFSATLLN